MVNAQLNERRYTVDNSRNFTPNNNYSGNGSSLEMEFENAHNSA